MSGATELSVQWACVVMLTPPRESLWKSLKLESQQSES